MLPRTFFFLHKNPLAIMLRLKLGASRGGSYENSLDDIRREDFFPIAFKKLKGSWVKCDWSITQIIFNDQSV